MRKSKNPTAGGISRLALAGISAETLIGDETSTVGGSEIGVSPGGKIDTELISRDDDGIS